MSLPVSECCGYGLENTRYYYVCYYYIFATTPGSCLTGDLCGVLERWGRRSSLRLLITGSAFSISLFEKDCTSKKREGIIFDGRPGIKTENGILPRCLHGMRKQEFWRIGIKLYMSNLHTIAFVTSARDFTFARK